MRGHHEDFGDAPDPYHCISDSAGPSCDVDDDFHLGKSRTVESDAHRPIGADGRPALCKGLGDRG
ncbi:hypothetical protein ACFV98_28925 [Streptomyces violascens]|uniref:hypothetical protein n=1 Tax=Streptomyces violascens TaxID=67381 RepID=UPI00364B8341